MSSENEQAPVDTERSRTEKLKALVRRDINDDITAMAEAALRRRQEDGDVELGER